MHGISYRKKYTAMCTGVISEKKDGMGFWNGTASHRKGAEDMEQVNLKLRSILETEDDRSETELMTTGTMDQKDGVWEISYLDSDATGFEGATTTIHADGTRAVSIVRTGTASSNLMIETGKKHYCLYGTPFGDLTVGIYTHKIENNLSEDGGSLYLKYTIDVNSAYMSDNEIYLDVAKL
jgi:uncharacterized beta-barrel protein YwiB (DUF1934 family)